MEDDHKRDDPHLNPSSNAAPKSPGRVLFLLDPLQKFEVLVRCQWPEFLPIW